MPILPVIALVALIAGISFSASGCGPSRPPRPKDGGGEETADGGPDALDAGADVDAADAGPDTTGYAPTLLKPSPLQTVGYPDVFVLVKEGPRAPDGYDGRPLALHRACFSELRSDLEGDECPGETPETPPLRDFQNPYGVIHPLRPNRLLYWSADACYGAPEDRVCIRSGEIRPVRLGLPPDMLFTFEPEGSFLEDSSGNRRNARGVPGEVPTFVRELGDCGGRLIPRGVKGAACFNGLDDRLQVSNAGPIARPGAIVMRVMPSTVAGSQTLLEMTDGLTGFKLSLVDGGRIVWEVNRSPIGFETTFTAGFFSLLILVNNGLNWSLYIDGESRDSGDLVEITPSDLNLFIGGTRAGGDYFSGAVDTIAFYPTLEEGAIGNLSCAAHFEAGSFIFIESGCAAE